MKLIAIITVIVFLIPYSAANGQEVLHREKRPACVIIGNEGLGMDVSVADYFAASFSTVAFYHSLKARIFVFNNNASPFIGIGAGSFNGFFGTGEANRWISLQAGWEHDYESLQIQFYLQRSLKEENHSSGMPFLFNISIGLRVL